MFSSESKANGILLAERDPQSGQERKFVGELTFTDYGVVTATAVETFENQYTISLHNLPQDDCCTYQVVVAAFAERRDEAYGWLCALRESDEEILADAEALLVKNADGTVHLEVSIGNRLQF